MTVLDLVLPNKLGKGREPIRTSLSGLTADPECAIIILIAYGCVWAFTWVFNRQGGLVEAQRLEMGRFAQYALRKKHEAKMIANPADRNCH